jgi:peroxiredoxin
MGNISFPITTKDPAVQRFFNQGVGQLHGFFYFEAERSFRQAAAIDSECAMAYWGMAMANVNNEKRAKGFVEKAEKLKSKVAKREQMWITLLSDYYKIGSGEREKRARAYVKGLEGILNDFPEDVEAKAFLAWTLWHHKDKGLPIQSHQAVDALIADVLRANPMHPGAHHYRIHLWDDEKPGRALGSAELFGPSSPGVAHAWHMPGHIYSKLHRYAEAARQQEASARVDHAHMIRDAVMPYQIHNYAHNNQWLITDLAYVGRVRDAVAVAENLIEIPRHPKLNKIEDSGGCARYGRSRLIETLVQWELWEALIARSDSYLAPIEAREDTVARLRALGTAFFKAGLRDRGRAAISELEAMSVPEKLPDDPKKKEAAEKERDRKLKSVRNALAELWGHLAAEAGDPKAALEHFKKADDLRKHVLARAYFEAGEKELAEKTARSAADGAKGQLAPRLHLIEILFLLGKRDAAAAAAAARDLENLVKEADPDLPVLKRVSAVLPAPGGRAPAPDVEALGPLVWRPPAAAPFSLGEGQGETCTVDGQMNHPLVLLFYLGSKCSHCVEQLGKFAEQAEGFAQEGISIAAVSVETPEELRAQRESGKSKYPFPLIADPVLKTFKEYRCYDDFEKLPLHGTFLVEAREGTARLRWQDISYTPFMEAKFLLGEAKRLLALPP